MKLWIILKGILENRNSPDLMERSIIDSCSLQLSLEASSTHCFHGRHFKSHCLGNISKLTVLELHCLFILVHFCCTLSKFCHCTIPRAYSLITTISTCIDTCTWATSLSNLNQTGSSTSKTNLQGNHRDCRKLFWTLGNS